MKIVWHLVYWLVVLLFLTLFFGQSWQNHLLAFYFSAMLLPIVVGTSYFFNLYLVPRYLLKGKYWQLGLYAFYMLVISLYLEMLVAMLAFVLIANYQMAVMSVVSTSIYVLGATLYLIVFATSFIRLVIQYRKKMTEIEHLEQLKERNEQTLFTFKANRKQHQIPLDDLRYIESLDDYVKVVTTQEEYITREKISSLQNTLPEHLIRIHRSYLVNKNQVTAYTNQEVTIADTQLPISRTYKKEAMERLKGQA